MFTKDIIRQMTKPPDCSPQIGAELNVGGVKRLTPPTLSSAERELGIEDCAYDREGEEAEEKKSEVAGRMERHISILINVTSAYSLHRHIAHSLSPGPWRELGVNDVQGLTKQGCSNNCGVFVLMYTLYIVMGANCDFREENMLQIRRWWCLVLLQNFPMPSKETRLQERKRRRKQKGKQDLEVVPPKSIRLSESVSEASAKAESLPEVGTGNGEDSLLMDTLTAARWCGTRSFKGKLYLPQVITMNKEDSLRAVEMLRMCDGLDEEYKEDLSEPFMFMFSLQADYEEFCKEMMDKRQLQVFSGFEMR
uniref:Ubiquitin-like protease family profile domain-containing protein n=1 Tax=Knipowitschia caucasica TaxID=637954 RepID=A0AAV2MJD9_KNICA